MKCEVCPRHCEIKPGQYGVCGARINLDGEIRCDSYGIVTALSLDPIEKKPLRRFFPGSNILSAGSYGCNLRCSFCQNHHISMVRKPEQYVKLSPIELSEKAAEFKKNGNIGLAYTYNEPLIAYEFVRDCAIIIAEQGMKNVVVTNGYINQEPLSELLPLIDAWNIDLKSFSDDFYRRIGGDVKTVKQTITLAATVSHVEVTTLVIPGENDSDEEMRQLTKWLASVDPGIPLHVSRFFPNFNMKDRPATPVDRILRLAEIARESLQYVYEGNL
ncbi:MAG: AmmeMemoRadiSam system radical SAM enzyme [Firmicutes bacterium HGW-Firmicutes-11]|nr:MAG: AmmeMemoRadiSam system radical SAM enzyme [Firmicutes bacterium HGW-Firmicutes-11]